MLINEKEIEMENNNHIYFVTGGLSKDEKEETRKDIMSPDFMAGTASIDVKHWNKLRPRDVSDQKEDYLWDLVLGQFPLPREHYCSYSGTYSIEYDEIYCRIRIEPNLFDIPKYDIPIDPFFVDDPELQKEHMMCLALKASNHGYEYYCNDTYSSRTDETYYPVTSAQLHAIQRVENTDQVDLIYEYMAGEEISLARDYEADGMWEKLTDKYMIKKEAV